MRKKALDIRKAYSVEPLKRSTVVLLAVGAASCMDGCRQAPTFNIMGSFFPAWLICLFVGVILAVVANRLLVRFRLDQQIVWQILVYPCLALFFACVLWLIFFR
jgi:Na+/glutamate symporter